MSEPRDDGGPAYPVAHNGYWCNGPSLRDWLAGQALAGLLANHEISMSPRDAAEFAYKQADAMLIERGKT